MPFVEVHGNELDSRSVRHVAVEREDYLGDAVGVGPTMAVRTERADGSYDTHVMAPTAVATKES